MKMIHTDGDRTDTLGRVICGSIAALIALAGAGCASPYAPLPVGGGDNATGYEEVRIDSTLYGVSFTGLAGTGRERIRSYSLYRSAELARDNGYPYLSVVGDTVTTHRSGYRGRAVRYRSTRIVRLNRERTGGTDEYEARAVLEQLRALVGR